MKFKLKLEELRQLKKWKDDEGLRTTSLNDLWALMKIEESTRYMNIGLSREILTMKDTERPRPTSAHDIESHTDLGQKKKLTLTSNLWKEKKAAIWNMHINMTILSAITTVTPQRPIP